MRCSRNGVNVRISAQGFLPDEALAIRPHRVLECADRMTHSGAVAPEGPVIAPTVLVLE